MSALEKRQGLKIACLEEIAFNNKWINKKNTISLNTSLSNYFYSYDKNDIYSRSVSLGISYQSFNDKLFLNTSVGFFF